MRFRLVTLVLSAVFLVTCGLTAGCTGDDNTLPLPPSDGGSDSGDAAKSEGGDAAKSDGGDAASGVDGEAAEQDTGTAGDGAPADAPPGDSGDGG